MLTASLVGLFGVAGALLRFSLDTWLTGLTATTSGATTPRRQLLDWPWATLAVNVVGSLIIGLAMGGAAQLQLGHEWSTALATGLAGGLTTFSSWTTGTVRLLSQSRILAATANLASNLILGLGAAALGLFITA